MAVSTGLELGASSVRAVSVERQGSRVRIVASAQAPWSGEPGDDLVASLKQLRRAMPIRSPVVVGIPSSSAMIVTVTPLVVNRARADLAIQFELQQQLPYDVAQAVWHAQWIDRRAPQHALVAAVKAQMLDASLDACRHAGIAVQEAQVNAVAAVNLWARQLGSSDVFEGGLLHFDSQVVEWLLVRPDGIQVIPIPVSPPTQPQGEVVAAIRESWSAVRDQLSGQAPGIIWLCGVALSASQGFVETLARELSCAVDLFDPTNLSGVTAVGAHEPHQLVIACGLAFQGIGLVRLPVNLIAERHAKRQAQTVRAAAYGVGACGLLLATALSANGMQHVRALKQDTLAKLTAQERSYQRLRSQIRKELQRQGLLEQRLTQLDDVWSARPLVIQMVQQLSEVMPDDVWLSRLELLKREEITGTVQGYARSFQAVTTMVDQLKSSVGWSSVRPQSTTVVPDPVSGKEILSFSVQIEHRPPKPSAAVESGEPAAEQAVAKTDLSEQKPRITIKSSGKPKKAK